MKKRIQASDQKLRELILLISEWSAPDEKFGAIKLNKLLFHCDFSAFLTFMKPITGQEYFALPQGPAPRRLKPITEKMKARQELAIQQVRYHNYIQQRPIALRAAKIEIFTSAEVKLISQTIQKFCQMSASEISDQSHLFLGWQTAKEKETIPYSTALVSLRKPTKDEKSRGLKLKDLADSHLLVHGQNQDHCS